MTNHKQVRILFLSHFYPPEMGGAAARISGLAKWLVKFGHNVTVITGYPNILWVRYILNIKIKKIELNL